MAETWMPKSARRVVDEDEAQPAEPWRPQSAQPAGPFARQTDIPMQGASGTEGDLHELGSDDRSVMDRLRALSAQGASATFPGSMLPRGSIEAASEASQGIWEGRGIGQSLEDAHRVYREEQARQDPTPAQSLRRGAAQGGSLGFGDEAAGALSALTGGLAEQAKKVARGDFSGVSAQDMLNLALHYRRGTDKSRARDDAAREANPGTFFVGELGGGAVIPGGAAAKGGSLLARGARTAAVGGLTGAVQGYGVNRDPDAAWSDIQKGGALGTIAGVAGPVLGKGAAKLIDALPENLKAKASEHALRAAGYIGNDFKRLIKGRGQEGAQQMGRELLDADVIPAGGTVQDVLERIQVARPEAGKAVGEFIDQAAATGRQFDVAPFASRVQSELIDANSRSPAVRPMVSRVDSYLDELLDESLPNAGFVDFPLAQQWKTQGQGVLSYGNPWNNAGRNIPADDMQKQLTRILKEEIDNQVEGALGPGTAEQFQAARRRYGALADAEDRAREGLAKLAGNNKASQTDLKIGALISKSAESVPLLGPLAVGGSRMVRQRADSSLARAADAAADLAATPAGTRFRQLAAALAESGAITPSAARAMIAEREAEEARSRPEKP